MKHNAEFYNLNDTSQGIKRDLAQGLSTRIFTGDHAMLSIVTIAPNASGAIHSHPEEQWGVLLDGEGVRIQGDHEIPVQAGDFWRTPGGVSHGFKAGPNGARILDVFSPPKETYKKPGKGFTSS